MSCGQSHDFEPECHPPTGGLTGGLSSLLGWENASVVRGSVVHVRRKGHAPLGRSRDYSLDVSS